MKTRNIISVKKVDNKAVCEIKTDFGTVTVKRTFRKHTNGIRATFSYRCIGMVTKLERTGLELKNILAIAVFKGMEKDTINNFRLYTLNNKYKTALNELQRVA